MEVEARQNGGGSDDKNLFMKHYELLCVLPGTLAEDEITPVIKQVESIIVENGGKSITIEDRGKIRLAHPIKHIRYGYFQVVQFEGEPESIAKINAKLGLIAELLRALITIFNPELRAEKNKRLKEMDAQEIPAGTTKQEDKTEQKEVVTKKELKPKPKAKKKNSENATDAPSNETMEKIEEKLDKVIDSALKDV